MGAMVHNNASVCYTSPPIDWNLLVGYEEDDVGSFYLSTNALNQSATKVTKCPCVWDFWLNANTPLLLLFLRQQRHWPYI